jgi:hypothetical protein
MFEIRPYAGVQQLTFGMSPLDAAARLGPPATVTTNRLTEEVHRYEAMLLTFDRDGLAEIGMLPESNPCVGGLQVLAPENFDELLELDGAPQETLGFIVLRRLGLTITGVHDGDGSQLAATAFRRGRWDRLGDQMRPFRRTED